MKERSQLLHKFLPVCGNDLIKSKLLLHLAKDLFHAGVAVLQDTGYRKEGMLDRETILTEVKVMAIKFLKQIIKLICSGKSTFYARKPSTNCRSVKKWVR